MNSRSHEVYDFFGTHNSTHREMPTFGGYIHPMQPSAPQLGDANEAKYAPMPEPPVTEQYSRKVFVGGLPIDVTEAEIYETFSRFGPVLVDWPRRADSNVKDQRASRQSTGYVFLIYEDEQAVEHLVRACHKEGDRFYLLVSSPTMREKPVQVRPWLLIHKDYMPAPQMFLDPRRTVFIGGVPRPTRAAELAKVLQEAFGPVSYVGIDIDPELNYPKGAARVTFSTTQSFIAAISSRFVNVPHAETNKRVEIKPYLIDDQMCDNCGGKFCGQRYAQYFCGDPSCLSYYCEACWDLCHYGQSMVKNRSSHRPFVRMGEQTKLLNRPTHHASGQGPIMSPPPSLNLTGSAARPNYGEAAASMSSLASVSNFNLSFFAPRPPNH